MSNKETVISLECITRSSTFCWKYNIHCEEAEKSFCQNVFGIPHSERVVKKKNYLDTGTYRAYTTYTHKTKDDNTF